MKSQNFNLDYFNIRPHMNTIVNKLRQPKFYLILAIFVFTAICIQMNIPDILIDDAFVSFRYAMNLANGKGLVFNPGEYVEGYTNFLWTVLLAGCFKLGFDLIISSNILNGLVSIGTIYLLYLIGKRLFINRRGYVFLISLPILIFAVMGSQTRYVLSGMETPLFTFLLLLAVYYFLIGKHPVLVGITFAFCAMTRPEGIIYFVLVLIYSILIQTNILDNLFPRSCEKFQPFQHDRDTKNIIFLMLGFLFIYGIYFIWRFNYYGHIFPNTFYAKAAGFHWIRLERGWVYLKKLMTEWKILPILIISVFSLLSILRRRVWLLFWLMVTATFAYFVYVGGDFIVWFGPRFLLPVLPIILLMCSEGLYRIFTLFPSSIQYHELAQLGLLSVMLIYTYLYSWPRQTGYMSYFSAQMRAWTEMGHWIADNTPIDTTIATDAAGLIPYYSERYSIDMFGLTDLHIAHMELPAPGEGIVAHEKFDPKYIMGRRPDCIISTWMDEKGHAVSAGLSSVASEFNSLYELIAVAKVKNGPPIDERWIIVLSDFTADLYTDGYVTGLFCKKQYLK